MSAEEATPHKLEQGEPRGSQPVLHRVCITCNNMFRVAPDNYEAKQCPNCHKAG